MVILVRKGKIEENVDKLKNESVRYAIKLGKMNLLPCWLSVCHELARSSKLSDR